MVILCHGVASIRTSLSYSNPGVQNGSNITSCGISQRRFDRDDRDEDTHMAGQSHIYRWCSHDILHFWTDFQLATWDYRRVSQFWCLVTTPDAIYCQPYSVGIPGFHFESRLGSLRNHGDNVRMGNIRIKRASNLKHSSRWHCWLMLVIIYPISNYFILFPIEATRKKWKTSSRLNKFK